MMQILHKYFWGFVLLLAMISWGGAQNWQYRSPMPTARKGVCVAALNGQAWLIGGMQTGHAGLNTVEVYDPAGNSWNTTQEHLQYARGNAVAATWNDRIYVFGGRNNFSLVSEVEMFDPQAGHWQVVSNLPTPRFGATVAVIDSAIWIIGGTDMSNQNYDLIEIYHPDSNTWQSMNARLNVPRGDPMAANLNGKIYVFGGYYFGPVRSYEVYNPATQSWQIAGNLLYRCGSAGYLSAAGRAVLIGGIGQGGVLDKVQVFHEMNGQPLWESGPQLNQPRRELAALELGGNIYTFGGRGMMGHQIYNTVEKLDLAVGINEPQGTVPHSTALLKNYPNPFNNETVLQISLPAGGNFSVSLLNLRGQLIQQIYQGKLSAGEHFYRIQGDRLASGVYILQLKGRSVNMVHKILLSK